MTLGNVITITTGTIGHVLWVLSKSLTVTIQMKASKQYFPVELLSCCKGESVDEILNIQNESYWAVPSYMVLFVVL